MNILVIQDRLEATTGPRTVLSAEGYPVVTVGTVEEAIAHPNGSRVGAVLVDGCRSVDEFTPHSPVIVITGHADVPAAVATLRHRAWASPLRTVSPAAVRSNLARVFGQRATEKQFEQSARLAGVGELAASVAHELNNALGTVTLRLETLLAKTPEADPRHHALEVVDQEVDRMSALVSTLLEFTRSGRGQASTLDVCEEVNKTVELTHHHLARKGVILTKEFAPGVPLIQADRQQLRQVLLNLFTNAADAMPDGGALTVRVQPGELTDGRPGVMIHVEDSGTGIPPDILARVTEAFFTTKEEGRGTGLGLSICKRIVEQHGGELAIESQVGVGTTIRMVLPLRPDPVS